MIRSLEIPAIVLLTLVLLAPTSARAEWVVLKSGEKFQTDRSWNEAGRLKFRLNGLVVSVPESDVAKVMAPGSDAPGAAASSAVAPNATGRPIAPMANTLPTPPLNRKQRLQGALKLPPPQTQLSPGKKSAPIAQLATPTDAAENRKNESPAPAPPPSRGVFRDLAWGMRPSSIPGLRLSQTDPAYGGVDEFYHPEEILHLGSAPLTGIVYGFWQNRLYTITVWADGRPSYEKLRQWVLDTYGPGRQSTQGVERQVWYGSGSDRLLEFDEALNTGIFWMRSEKLHVRIQQMQAQ